MIGAAYRIKKLEKDMNAGAASAKNILIKSAVVHDSSKVFFRFDTLVQFVERLRGLIGYAALN